MTAPVLMRRGLRRDVADRWPLDDWAGGIRGLVEAGQWGEPVEVARVKRLLSSICRGGALGVEDWA